MTGSVGEHAMECSQPRWKGRNRARMSALEASYDGYRVKVLMCINYDEPNPENASPESGGSLAQGADSSREETWSIRARYALLAGAAIMLSSAVMPFYHSMGNYTKTWRLLAIGVESVCGLAIGFRSIEMLGLSKRLPPKRSSLPWALAVSGIALAGAVFLFMMPRRDFSVSYAFGAYVFLGASLFCLGASTALLLVSKVQKGEQFWDRRVVIGRALCALGCILPIAGLLVFVILNPHMNRILTPYMNQYMPLAGAPFVIVAPLLGLPISIIGLGLIRGAGDIIGRTFGIAGLVVSIPYILVLLAILVFRSIPMPT